MDQTLERVQGPEPTPRSNNNVCVDTTDSAESKTRVTHALQTEHLTAFVGLPPLRQMGALSANALWLCQRVKKVACLERLLGQVHKQVTAASRLFSSAL